MKIKTLAFMAIAVMTLLNISCSQKQELTALVVTGQNNHNWQRSSVFLMEILNKSGIFTCDQKVSPATGKDMSEFIIDFTPYDVVVLDYNGDEWPPQTKINFVNYVKDGGGVVVYHAADNAFPDWPEYNEMIGLGGWGDRDENSGPYVYIKDGEEVKDNSPGRGGSHGAQHEFIVEAFNPEHPILKGLPMKWRHVQDELYSELRGPANNMEVLAFSHANEKFGGTGKNEPVLMTINYEKGRIFHTVLGHASGGAFSPAMECAGFVTTLQRGAEWAATGKVTQEVPKTFPTETETLQWEFFEDISSDLTIVINRMERYQIGKSYDAFNILKKLIAENINNKEKMEEYHKIILGLLQSSKATDECKKILLKEFSWMANDAYLEVYRELAKNPELETEAQYATSRIGEN